MIIKRGQIWRNGERTAFVLNVRMWDEENVEVEFAVRCSGCDETREVVERWEFEASWERWAW